MTLRGHVEKGAVVLDEPIDFPDGTDVEIEIRAVAEPETDDGPTLYERLKDVIGTAQGLPADMAENHNHYIHGVPKRTSP